LAVQIPYVLKYPNVDYNFNKPILYIVYKARLKYDKEVKAMFQEGIPSGLMVNKEED
jgi:hypothetical protein